MGLCELPFLPFTQFLCLATSFIICLAHCDKIFGQMRLPLMLVMLSSSLLLRKCKVALSSTVDKSKQCLFDQIETVRAYLVALSVMNAFSVKPLLLKMKSNLSSTGFSPSLSNGLCALHAAVQGLRKLHFWLKVSLKLHIYYFLTLLTAAVVSKWIHLQFTIYMPFFSAVQRSFLLAIPSASQKKNWARLYLKAMRNHGCTKYIVCTYFFVVLAVNSEAFSFLSWKHGSPSLTAGYSAGWTLTECIG